MLGGCARLGFDDAPEPPTTTLRASATVYREPVTRMTSSSDAAVLATASASATLENVSVGTPAAVSALATSFAGRARTLSTAVA